MPNENTQLQIGNQASGDGKVRVRLETGQTIVFDRAPSQQDIDEVANRLQITKPQQQQEPQREDKTFLEQATPFVPGGQLAKGTGMALAAGDVERIGEEALELSTGAQTRALQKLKELEQEGDQEKIARARRALQFATEGVEQASQVQREFDEDRPTTKQMVGSASELATLGLPLGALTRGATTALRAARAGQGLARTGGRVLAGGATGLASDVGAQLASGREQVRPGVGTALGAIIPGAAPLIGRARKLATKGVAEAQGALTGTSGETLELAFEAVRKGGADAQSFTQALRKQLTPEDLARNARESAGQIASRQQTAFREGLSAIADEAVDTSLVAKNFEDGLKQANILVKDGALDFSKSRLRTVPQAQAKLQSAYDEILRFGRSTPLEELDTTRQALKALRLAGDDSSANLANKFIDDGVRTVREAGEKIPGYKKILDDFGSEAEFLDELQRSLQSGNKKTIDQTYRTLAKSLKTNNERRLNLVQQLDDATGGTLLSQIAGQQLSEELPRGIFRQIAAGATGIGVLTGASLGSFIPLFIAGSPRITGEVIRILGLGARRADLLKKSIQVARQTLSKTYGIPVEELWKLFIVGSAQVQNANTPIERAGSPQ